MSIVEDNDFKECCDIIEKLGNLGSEFMVDLLISLSANYKDVRNYILNYYSELLDEEEEFL